MIDDRSIGAGLVIRSDLHALGQSFARAWPVDRGARFNALLDAIEEAHRELTSGPAERENS